MNVINRVLSALALPASDLELRRERDGGLAPIPLPAARISYDPSKGLILELSDENTTLWELLREHLRRDRLWTILNKWKKAMIAHVQARLALERETRLLLQSETKFEVTEGSASDGEQGFIFPITVSLFYGVTLNRALGIPDKTNPEERIIAAADGYVLHRQGGSQLAYCLGRQETQNNLQDVPDQSGIYLIRNRKGACQYVGSAGAGRLAARLKEHLQKRDIPGVHTFQIRTATSEEEARKLERQYRGRYRPRYST